LSSLKMMMRMPRKTIVHSLVMLTNIAVSVALRAIENWKWWWRAFYTR
jgi:hypothetical protein